MRKLLAENLISCRKGARFTQEKLAEASGVSLRMLQDIEAEDSWPSPETIEKLSHAMGIEEAILFRDPKIRPTIPEAFSVIQSLVEDQIVQRKTTPELMDLWKNAEESDREVVLNILKNSSKIPMKKKTKIKA